MRVFSRDVRETTEERIPMDVRVRAMTGNDMEQIGRASCRERVCQYV
jgi:hypothetical protein